MTLPLEFYLRNLLPREMYWHRDGTPYPAGDEGMLQWGRDFQRHGLRVVNESWTPWGDHISTVWLGMDHAVFAEQPIIFETMIFNRRGSSVYCERYATELEALAGHDRATYRAFIPPPIVRFLQKHFGQG